MPSNMITVYRAGVFHTEPEPPWRTEARAGGSAGVFDSINAISSEIDREGSMIAIQQSDIFDTNVVFWNLPSGARYVEFRSRHVLIDGVLIPRQEDWLPFYVQFVSPFLQGSAAVALSHHQAHAANVLTARARHGEGKHVNIHTGRSDFDCAD